MTQFAIISNDEIVNIIEAEDIGVVNELGVPEALEVPFENGIGTLRIGMKRIDGQWRDVFFEQHDNPSDN